MKRTAKRKRNKMNRFKMVEIMAIGIAIEQLHKALETAEAEGNDYCAEHLRMTIKEAGIALSFAENCDRGAD